MEDFTRELTPGNTKVAMKAVGALYAAVFRWGIKVEVEK